jgi:hypothetical protein
MYSSCEVLCNIQGWLAISVFELLPLWIDCKLWWVLRGALYMGSVPTKSCPSWECGVGQNWPSLYYHMAVTLLHLIQQRRCFWIFRPQIPSWVPWKPCPGCIELVPNFLHHFTATWATCRTSGSMGRALASTCALAQFAISELYYWSMFGLLWDGPRV